MIPLLLRYARWWENNASCSGDSSRGDGSSDVIMSRFRVASATSAALVFSCAWMSRMPAACSAFVAPVSLPSTSRCACRSAQVTVNIERPSINSRRISGSIVINRPIEVVWLTLTDYNRLAEYVPNLTQSRVRASDDGTIKLWQEGAQKIVGFDFRASVEMFMDEHHGDPENRVAQRKLTFGLLESRMFNGFDGEWRMQYNSRKQLSSPNGVEYEYSTKLFYMVNIKPKGPVPVVALEWQISNEVPNNLKGLKRAAESATPEYIEMRRREREAEFARANASQGISSENIRDTDGVVAKVGAEAFVARGNENSRKEWDTDETLEAYIAKG